jgi:cobalt-zinc-cadmium efflux system outer membrane protein
LAPAPRHGGVELGVSFPIPLFNRAKGEIQSAEVRRKQAELRYLQAEREVTTEVINAFNEYKATDRKLKFFTAGIVKTAKEVLDEKRREYHNGEIHLIEVLDAQRSYDEILHSLYSVIYDKSMALVKLETAMGIWNIE